jgi:hypothetical protein
MGALEAVTYCRLCGPLLPQSDLIRLHGHPYLWPLPRRTFHPLQMPE